MIHLHTLGDTLIQVGTRSVRPTSPLMFAALLYLGMERGRRVPRAALQEVLFSNGDERSGAHSLRQLLYKLRQLRAPIEADAGTVFVAEEDVRDDATSDLVLERDVGQLASGFLPDYHPDLSERFTEWLDRQRDAVAASIRTRLVSAIEASREALDWRAVERHARLLQALDPYNEVGVFARAESAAMSGGKTAALRILDQYQSETGRSDLTLPASVLRKRIARSVREPSLRFAAIPFRGRDADVRDLRKHITRACNGTPTLYLIGAEPGIGKTRLLEETSGLAALEGVKVHTVRCHSHYAGRPLSVFIELVPALRASRGALGISPDSLECLNFLTSHTDDRSDQPSDARDNVTRSELLLAALRDLIDAVASEQPLMLCVEDAHWADPDSLRELNRLVQSPASRPLIVICTTRTPESFPHIPATDDRTVVRRLKPLSEASMVGLAQHLLPQDGAADPAVTSWCVETAAGNPLFLQMLCAHHATTREPFSVPADLTAAITRRVEQLNPRCRRVLELTSLLGRHSTIETIRLINDWTHLELLDAVQVLEEDGYLRDTGTSLRAHGLVGECALSLLPPVSRRVLHACVAAALETQYTERGDAALLWDCAEQWVKSGDSEKAVEFLRRCARHTRQLGRSAEAVSILKRAKELTSSRGASDAMSTEIILAAKAANMWHVAYETSRAIASIVSNAHDEVELASIEAEWFFLSQPATSIPRVTQCMRTLETGHLHRIAAARLAIMMAHEACDAQLGQSLFAEVEPLIAVHPDSIDGQLLTLYFHAIFGSKDVALGMSRELRARISSVATGDRFRVATITAVACVFCGAYDEAIEILSRSVAEAREQELFTRVHNIASTACSTLLSALRYDEAMIWYELAQEVKPHAEQGMRSAIHLSNEVELAILEESAKRATDALSEFNNLAISNSPRFRSYALGLRTRVAQLARDFVLDPAAFEEMLDLHLRTRAYGSGDSLATALAEDLRRRKDPSLQPFLASYVSERREGPNLTAHFRAFVD